MQYSLFSHVATYTPSVNSEASALYVRDPNGTFVPADTSLALHAARKIAHQVLQ